MVKGSFIGVVKNDYECYLELKKKKKKKKKKRSGVLNICSSIVISVAATLSLSISVTNLHYQEYL